jgi:cell wall-associated NlpC family hydrolase
MRSLRAILFFGVLCLMASEATAQHLPVKARRAAILRRADTGARIRYLSPAVQGYTDDCTGFVRWSYSAAGVELFPERGRTGENGVQAIHRKAKLARALHWRAPRPGDLVFFRETYDKNRDGRRNDGLTHVGIVEEIESDGTVVYLHRAGKGIVRSRLNPGRPSWHTRNGKVWNDYVRGKQPGSRAYLSGELFAGYASAAALRR